MEKLWTPFETPARREAPTVRKADGGSYFDDELGSEEDKAKAYADETMELLHHLAQRPDHTIYVSSVEQRTKMRDVCNWWYREGALLHHPNIRIDYGIADGSIRVDQ